MGACQEMQPVRICPGALCHHERVIVSVRLRRRSTSPFNSASVAPADGREERKLTLTKAERDAAVKQLEEEKKKLQKAHRELYRLRKERLASR